MAETDPIEEQPRQQSLTSRRNFMKFAGLTATAGAASVLPGAAAAGSTSTGSTACPCG